MYKYNRSGLNRAETNFLAGADTPDVHVRASTLCCFPSLSTQTFANFTSRGWKEEAGEGGGLTRETYRGDIFRLMHADKVCPFNGVTMEPEQSL